MTLLAISLRVLYQTLPKPPFLIRLLTGLPQSASQRQRTSDDSETIT